MSNEQNGVKAPDPLVLDNTLLPAVQSQLTPLQTGWLAVGFTKKLTADALTKAELEVQRIIKEMSILKVDGLPLAKMNETLKAIQEKLAAAKSKAEAAKQQRLVFTNYLNEIVIEPLMVFEKRNIEQINTAIAYEFAQRGLVVLETGKEQDKINEKAQYKAHIENEYFRIGELYRAELQTITLDAYSLCLKDKDTDPASRKKELATMLSNVKLQPTVKYVRTLVTDTEALEIIKSITAYSSHADLSTAIENIETVFAVYESDIARGQGAIAEVEAEKNEVVTNTQAAIQQETAINDLTAKAGTYSLAGGPSIKKKLEVVKENTSAWGLTIMATFIKHFDKAGVKITAKTWEKVNVGQMAEALAKVTNETGTKFQGINYKEVEK